MSRNGLFRNSAFTAARCAPRWAYKASHQTPGGMAVEQQPIDSFAGFQDVDGGIDILQVVVDGAGEVGQLVGAHGPAVTAQVERIKMQARLVVKIGQMGLKEVVHVAVHIQNGLCARAVAAPAHQHRTGQAIIGRAAGQGGLLKARQHIGRPAGRLHRCPSKNAKMGAC